MHDKIKELANKALKYPDNDDDGLTIFDNDELKKFAELIVAECIDVVGKATASPNGCQALMKHFGVEECLRN